MSDPFGIPGFSPHLAQHMDFTRQLAEHIARIDAILRANQMHEATCAYLRADPMYAECDCWLADP